MIEINKVKQSLFILEKDPDNIDANYLLSVYLSQKNKISKVYPFITKVTKSKNPLKGSFLILGKYFEEHRKEYLKAIELYKKELESYPESIPTLINLAKLLAHTGEVREALKYYKKIIELDPKDKLSYDSLLLFAPYDLNTSDQELLEYAKLYKENVFNFTTNQDFSHLKLERQKENLRIGFVSGDYKRHSVIFFIKNLFDLLSKKAEIYCYCNNLHDSMTEEIKKENVTWRDVLGLDTEVCFEMIKKDKIDVLIDLSGNTGKNRLDIFARRPSPVQISWLGQSAPFGINEIDYQITNKDLILESEKNIFNEKPLFIDTVYAPFTAPHENIEIKEAPYKKNGFITFACFNNFLKINTDTLKLWSEILNQTENSKLYLKSNFFEDQSFQDKIYSFFKEQGIEKERLILKNFSKKKREYLQEYNEVDIALDPLPIGGATTTNDLLYMGVPLVTLYGKRMSQRISSNLLKAINCSELIAESAEEYVEIASRLAKNKDAISDYKNCIREKYLSSKICNKELFAEKFYEAIVQAWREKMGVLR